MTIDEITISFAQINELSSVGELMTEVYSQLEGFPSIEDQPSYYEQFKKLDEISAPAAIEIIVAKNSRDEIIACIVYFSDMQFYGAGGEATISIKNASGIRLLAVSTAARGLGIGRKLTKYCIDLAKESCRSKVILHTTQFMPAAWSLYQQMGFTRYAEIDFKQGDLDVFGFKLSLIEKPLQPSGF